MIKKILTAMAICLLAAEALPAQVAVIAHKEVPVDTIHRTDLLNFYVLDIKSWKNGESVVVFDLKNKTERKEAFYDFLGKSTSRMKSIWMKKLLSGEGNPPEALLTEEEMLNKVKSTPGAIGFVGVDKVKSDVKLLMVIEKK